MFNLMHELFKARQACILVVRADEKHQVCSEGESFDFHLVSLLIRCPTPRSPQYVTTSTPCYNPYQSPVLVDCAIESKMLFVVVCDLYGAGLHRSDQYVSAIRASIHKLTLPHDPQVLVSPSTLAPHLGQSLWKSTKTVVDCILTCCFRANCRWYWCGRIVSWIDG